MNSISKILRSALTLTVLLLSACGGGGGATSGSGATTGYTIGGTVTGLSGSVVLQNNGGDNLTISTNGNFSFASTVSNNGSYAVTVLTQPSGQTCSVSTGAGTVSGNNVSNVAVVCSTSAYTVGGTVSGLTGSVVLQDNNGDNLTVSTNGAFIFATAVAQGSPYAVTVLTQPSGQNCSVASGIGAVSGANISNVTITCAANMFTVGGTVSGLSGTVVLQKNGGDNLTISTNGNFTFASAISDAGTYTVTVLTQPSGQTCSVSTGTGTVSGGNVTGIALVCATNTMIVGAGATSGGTWSGTNPDIFTPNAPMAMVSVTDIQSRLNAGTPVTLTTSPSALGDGDIFINSTIAWSANTLTVKARRNITFNTALNGSGTAGLALEYGQGAVAAGNTNTYKVSAPVNLASTGSFTTKLGSDGAVKSYTILTSLGAAGSVTTTDLQGMNGNVAGNYVLGANIDAIPTSGWNAGAGFASIGTSPAAYTGTFDGLGHTIDGLTSRVGLYGATLGATLRNVGLTNVNINGLSGVGALVVMADQSAISNSYSTGNVVGSHEVGGLVGDAFNNTTIADSHSGATVSGSYDVGGLVGTVRSGSGVTNSYATGNVNGGGTYRCVGGLVGCWFGDPMNVTAVTLDNSYATGNVTASGASDVGGLVGSFESTGITVVSNSYATGNVSGLDHVGGLVGQFTNNPVFVAGTTTPMVAAGTAIMMNPGTATVTNSYATGTVSGRRGLGGLIGMTGRLDMTMTVNWDGLLPLTVNNSHALGNVTGSVASSLYLGGLVGYGSSTATINNSYATGSVTGTRHMLTTAVINPEFSYFGGLLGYADGIVTITHSHATGNVSGTGMRVAGLVSMTINGSSITGSYATGNVTSDSFYGANVGGLTGAMVNGPLPNIITDSYATGNVYGSGFAVGGLVGMFGGNGLMTRTYASGIVTAASHVCEEGGLVGSAGMTAMLTDSFWDTQTSGQASGTGTCVPANFIATGKTTAQMKSQATYIGWDFVNTWQIVEGASYPTLR